MTDEIKLGIKSVLEQRKEYDALNYINELEERLETVIQSLHEQCEIVSKQVEQIEKMKNVGNCKHSMKCAKWNEKQCNLGLMKFCLNCKNWELAE